MSQAPIEVFKTANPRKRPADSELGFGRVFSDHMFMMDYEQGAWQRPRIVPYGPLTLDPSAMVFHYGQALFEGMKAFRGVDGKVRLFRPEQHCHRMREGVFRMCIAPVEAEQILQAITALVWTDQDWVPRSPGTALYIRPTVVATEPALGVRAAQRYTFFIIISPVGPYYPEGWKPLRIWIEEYYVRAARGGTGAVKAPSNYAGSLLAAEEARKRGYTQVLWLDASERRWIEEVGTMNLFVRIGDEVATAPLSGTILPGVTRDSVLTLLQKWGVPCRERPISVDELLAAHRTGVLKEVFGCGTAAVIAPVGELGYQEQRLVINEGRVGELSQRLYDTITGIQYGRVPDTHGWLVELAEPPNLKLAAPVARAS